MLLIIVPLVSGAAEKDDPPDFKGIDDKCLSEKASLEKGKLSVTNDSGSQTYMSCKNANNQRGCTLQLERRRQCSCGTVMFSNVSAKECPAISKCDPNYKAKLSACINSSVLRPLLADAAEKADFSGIREGRPLTNEQKALWCAFGICDEERATELAKKDGAEDFLKQAAQDPDSAAEKGRELGLSQAELDNLKNNAVRLQPDQVLSAAGSSNSEAVETFRSSFCQGREDCSNTTFGSQTNTHGSGQNGNSLVIDPTGSPNYATKQWRDRQGNLAEAVHPTVLGQITGGAQRDFCEYRASLGRACNVTPEAQYATMMLESDTNVRILGDGGCSASLAQAYACQSGWANFKATYKAAYGEEYRLDRINIKDPSINPEWIASQSTRMQAVILQDKADRTGGDFGRMVTAYNGSSVYGVRAIGNANLLQSGGANSYWQTAYNSALASAESGPTITNLAATDIPTGGVRSASPFGNVTPFFTTSAPVGRAGPTGYASPGAYATPVYSPTVYPSPYGGAGGMTYAQPVSSLPSPTLVSSLLTQPGPQVITPQPLLQPVAVIIAQPREVSRGGSLVVSWSTIGMNALDPCYVYLESGGTNTLFARGNEGSRTLITSATSTVGVWNFTLQCLAFANGQLVRQMTSVLVR